MSLNNWLCKHFDDEKKGYVTIADFARPILIAVGMAFIIFFMAGMFSAGYQGMVTPEHPGNFSELIIVLLLAWVLPIQIIISLAIALILGYRLLRFIDKISKIKIAKCPLKEQEEGK